MDLRQQLTYFQHQALQSSGTVAATGGVALAAGDAVTTGTYYAATVTAGCESARVASAVTVATKPTAPVVISLINPTCTVTTATVGLGGLPATGLWSINVSPTIIQTTGTGTSTTFQWELLPELKPILSLTLMVVLLRLFQFQLVQLYQLHHQPLPQRNQHAA